MSMQDRYGLPVSTSSPLAFAQYQAGMDGLLSYGPGTDDAFAAALAVDDGLALAHAGRALLAFVMGDAAAARAGLARARALVSGASRREQQHVEILDALLGGRSAEGLALIEEHLKDFPRDALLVNQASSTIGFSGRADRERAREAFFERLAPAYGDDWWFQSALAFTHHETGRLEDARRLSERSLAQYPGNANASHNLAHVYYEVADHDGGVAFLEGWLAGYDRRAPFHCHLAWHVALFELQRGDSARALEIYHLDIAASGNPRLSLMDGAALLWRFTLYDCGERALPWEPLTELAARVSRPGFVFGDLHAALTYAATGDHGALATLVDSLRGLAAQGHPIAASLAVPLVRAAASFAEGDFAAAAEQLEGVESEIHRMGGSHAQWEIFEETLVVCYLRLGRYDRARRLLRRRLARRPSVVDATWLARAADGSARES
jgi:tetratricopeptide (TPR) repeat protein